MQSEPQKMAPFLKQRCDEGRYGLSYVDEKRSLIYIPWPVAPRPNENLPPGFQMFREWASLSFKKRNVEGDGNEAATTQKHRFRNALARADGIVARKDIQMPGGRVYEFVDSKRSRKYSDGSSVQQSSPHPDGSTVSDPTEWNDDFQQKNDFYHIVPKTDEVYGVQNGIEQYQIQNFTDESYAVQAAPYYSTALNDSTHPWVDDSGHYCGEMTPTSEITGIDVSHQPYQEPAPYAIPQMMVLGQPQNDRGPVQVDQSGLDCTLQFRGSVVSQFYVKKPKGTRLYYGSNIPDITQLVEREHLENITSPFKYSTELLFGPDYLQQVKLPDPDGTTMTRTQLDKTKAILDNMARGLILYIDDTNGHLTGNVPDVWAMRLCQTRIFPGPARNQNEQQDSGYCTILQPESLKRMQWVQVFDAMKFHTQLMSSPNGSKHPSPKFCLSLGQRSTDDVLLVSLSVTVQRANQALLDRLDADNRDDVCISKETSMDLEAKHLAWQLKETMTL